MPNLLAMSFEGMLAPTFQVTDDPRTGSAPDGWGLGFYPGQEPSAVILREHIHRSHSLESQLAGGWDQLASSIFLLHVRQAQWGPISLANTQPFSRTWGGRDWMLAHAGSLERAMPVEHTGPFEPVGLTDTENLFCILLNRMVERGWRQLADCDLEVVHGWLQELDKLGTLNIVLTDGLDLLAYADLETEQHLRIWERSPPYNMQTFGDEQVQIDMFKRGMTSRKGLVISSDPLFQGGQAAEMTVMDPGELIMVRQGVIRTRLGSTREPEGRAARGPRPPIRAEPRRMSVRHRTVYRYDKPVERSSHLLRLTPVVDRLQRVLSHDVTVSVRGRSADFDDVFGNRCRRVLLEEPYTELEVIATSVVDLLDTDPLLYRPLRGRRAIPLVWMPWQQQVLQPFLLPQELPESQLRALIDYAQSFVTRNDYDILETMLDINWTLFSEYTYTPGSTTIQTSAWDVYTQRQGVCQDFTNLMITLARLLGVPARYVCGYVYTGPKNPNQIQSEASHAWVQLFLPELGWTGFDPTNGCMTQTDHVRVAVGRNYVDATPTSGTIYLGGGGETLEVDVRTEPIEGSTPITPNAAPLLEKT